MDYDIATTITDVTVYPDRAQVTRQGEIQIEEAGEHLLRVDGLPLALQRETLRALGTGPAGTLILGIEQETSFHTAAPEAELTRLRTEIQRLEREIAGLEAQESVLDEQHGWIRTLAEHSARGSAWAIARGERQPQDAASAILWAAEQARGIEDTRLDIQHMHQDATLRLESLRREYEQLTRMQAPDRVMAAVRIRAPEAGTITLRLSYLIGGAGWHPRYDARIDREHAQARLAHQALVRQRTGENWPHVALTLSTARPAAAIRLPDEIAPWYVDIMPPIRPLAMEAGAPHPMMVREAAQMARRAPHAAMAEAPEMVAGGTEIEATGSIRMYHLPGGIDIPSDGQPHIVSIGEHVMDCQFEYVAMPAFAEGAHLCARARNTTGQVLLPGELHIFREARTGDEFTGTTRLDLTAENAELPFFLGVDDNITVKRELTERDTDKGTLLQWGIRRATISYRATLGNRTDERQHIILKDHLPVTRNEKIKVSLLEARPQPATRTKLDQLTWQVDLAPGQEIHVEWRFTIESPAETELTGMP